MENMFQKHFTLEEANAMLPALQTVFREVHRLVAEMVPGLESAPKPANGNGNGNGNGKGHGNGHGHHVVLPSSPEERVAAANELLNQIARKGIVIQDWRRGLIDFPHIKDGREVFLCYELADGDQIVAFHDVDAGFSGREPL